MDGMGCFCFMFGQWEQQKLWRPSLLRSRIISPSYLYLLQKSWNCTKVTALSDLSGPSSARCISVQNRETDALLLWDAPHLWCLLLAASFIWSAGDWFSVRRSEAERLDSKQEETSCLVGVKRFLSFSFLGRIFSASVSLLCFVG